MATTTKKKNRKDSDKKVRRGKWIREANVKNRQEAPPKKKNNNKRWRRNGHASVFANEDAISGLEIVFVIYSFQNGGPAQK